MDDEVRAWMEALLTRWGRGAPEDRSALEQLVSAAGQRGLPIDASSADSADTFVSDLQTDERTMLSRGGARYLDRGVIGAGSGGEVSRVRDQTLARDVALKALHPRLASSEAHRTRLVAEARLTAGLQHPGVVPVHDLGELPDGRPFFTMELVEGQTFAHRIADVHARSGVDGWGSTPSGWSLRRLVEVLRRVAETVACAHASGIVHRDLKPHNVMLGAYDAVRTVDWGLARADDPSLAREARSGTPGYMAPEQATGEGVGPRADVYGLGAMLFEILTGRPPHRGKAEEILVALRAGEIPDPEEIGATPPMPKPLLALCRRAMALEPSKRPESAEVFARALTDWLDGLSHGERARGLLAEAKRLTESAQRLQDTADAWRRESEEALRHIPATASEVDKHGPWALADAATLSHAEARALEARSLAILHAALTLADLPSARRELAFRYVRQHREAEESGDAGAAAVALAHLEEADLDPEGRARVDRYLQGVGSLTLASDPAGAAVFASPVIERNRRLVPGPAVSLGVTPLVDHPLPMGSWLIDLRAPGRADVRVPVRITREGRWDGEDVVVLPASTALDADDVWIPAGPFPAGGDSLALAPWRGAIVHLPTFVVRRHPVTFGEWLVFLDALAASGREAEAWAAAPRLVPGASPDAPPAVARVDGRFVLVPDDHGVVWDLRWPVVMIDWPSANAYGRWFAEATGRPWRLPTELEWEKAARGVDGRFYPFGNHLDPTWACIQDSGERHPVAIDAYPADRSPYGVRGLAGNVRDWCADVFTAGAPDLDGTAPDDDPSARRAYRGGSWLSSGAVVRSASRLQLEPGWRDAFVGCRLARSIDAVDRQNMPLL